MKEKAEEAAQHAPQTTRSIDSLDSTGINSTLSKKHRYFSNDCVLEHIETIYSLGARGVNADDLVDLQHALLACWWGLFVSFLEINGELFHACTTVPDWCKTT
jgi:hypothetical protein